MNIVIVDTETTGLDPDVHEIWEVGLMEAAWDGLSRSDEEIEEGMVRTWNEHHWFLPVQLHTADPIALSIGRFHERHPQGNAVGPDGHSSAIGQACRDIARLTHGKVLVGAVPSFDEQRLRRLLLDNGEIPSWHYRPICVETLIAGYLSALRAKGLLNAPPIAIPWDSTKLSNLAGIDTSVFDKHTALGDCRWAAALWDIVFPTAGVGSAHA